MDDIYKCIEEYNQNKKQKILILFQDMIFVMLGNEKRNQLVTKLLNKAKKFLLLLSNNILLYQKILDLIHYFIMKIPNKNVRRQIAFNHSSDIKFKSFVKFYVKCTAKPNSYLVN